MPMAKPFFFFLIFRRDISRYALCGIYINDLFFKVVVPFSHGIKVYVMMEHEKSNENSFWTNQNTPIMLQKEIVL